MCAIMGPFGSGKTTLLRILSGQLEPTAGEVRVNGNRETRFTDQWKRMASYIQQEDALHTCLTLRQVLAFRARLYGMRGKVADDAVTLIIEKMCLGIFADSRIGDSLSRQRSGVGQRCAIAMELLKRPRVMFLEDTLAGLDHLTALELASTVRGICVGAGEPGPDRMLIVWVLSQPSSKVFRLFDHLVLLRHGSVAFAGPSEQAETYFAALNPRVGYVPPWTSPAEHILEILQDDEEPAPAMVPLPSQAERTPAVKALWVSLAARCIAFGPRSGAPTLCLSCLWFHQIWVLFWRALLIRLMDSAQCRDRILLSLLPAVNIGFFYWKVQDTQVAAADRQTVIFLSLVLLLLSSLVGSALQFHAQKTIVRWECKNGIYGFATWHVANLSASFLAQAVCTTIYVTIVYWMVGLWDDGWHFVLFLSVCQMLGAIGVGLGIVLIAAADLLCAGDALSAPVAVPGLVFLCSALVVRCRSVSSSHWRWLRDSSFLEQAFRLLLTDQLKDFSFAPCLPFQGPGEASAQGDFCPLGPGRRSGDLWLEGMLGYPAFDGASAEAWSVMYGSLAAVWFLSLLAVKLHFAYT